MANHPTRSQRLRSIEPPLGWTYGQYLPEITELLLAKLRVARDLDKQLKELRREIHQDVAAQWTPEEIEQAKKAVQDEYERAAGKSIRSVDLRVC